MSTIIIITPPPKDPPARAGEPDGFAQDVVRTSPYREALHAIRQAEADGARVQIVEG